MSNQTKQETQVLLIQPNNSDKLITAYSSTLQTANTWEKKTHTILVTLTV